MATIGLMEGAYFVGRKEIMDFVNTTLELRLNKVEETASGCVACQLLDMMFPNTVPMSKVDWSANKNFEYVANYKILQTCFTKLHIDRHIDVDRLISGKYMDNLEFMQWFKRYFELNGGEKGSYDCRGQRAKGKGGSSVLNASLKPSGMPTPAAKKVVASIRRSSKPPVPLNRAPAPFASGATQNTVTVDTPPPVPPRTAVKKFDDAHDLIHLTSEIAVLNSVREDNERAFNELRLEMDGLEKERDFYFDKLRDIEIILQDSEDLGNGTEVTAAVFKVLYATQVRYRNDLRLNSSDCICFVLSLLCLFVSASDQT
jgi:microtubule-associated protein, RP/EB family